MYVNKYLNFDYTDTKKVKETCVEIENFLKKNKNFIDELKKFSDYTASLIGKKLNKIEKNKVDKNAKEILEKAKDISDKIEGYIVFCLSMNCEEIKKHNNSLDDIYTSIFGEVFNTLSDMDSKISKFTIDIRSFRGMGLEPDKIVSKYSIDRHIKEAKIFANQLKNRKRTKNALLEAYNHVKKLDFDGNALDNMIITLAGDENNDLVKQAKMTSELLTKVSDGILGFGGSNINNVSALLFVNKKKSELLYKDFWGYEIIPDEEKLKILMTLKLEGLETKEQIKDFIVKENNQLKFEINKNGELEITVEALGSLNNNFYVNTAGTERNANLGSGNRKFTYIYDLYKNELKGFKVSAEAKAIELNYSNEIDEKIKNDFNTFLGGLSAELGFDFRKNLLFTMDRPKLSAELIKAKHKISKKCNEDLTVESIEEIGVGTCNINGLKITPKPINVKIETSLANSKRKSKLKIFDINLYTNSLRALKDNIAFKFTLLSKLGMKIQKDKTEFFFGKPYTPIISADIDNKTQEISFNDILKDSITTSKEFAISVKEILENKPSMMTNEEKKQTMEQLVELMKNYDDVKRFEEDFTDYKLKNDIEPKGLVDMIYLLFGEKEKTKEYSISKNEEFKNDNKVIDVLKNTSLNIEKESLDKIINIFEKNEKTIEKFFDGIITEKDAKELIARLKNIEAPEKYLSHIRNAETINENTRVILQNSFESLMQRRIDQLINNKDYDKLIYLELSTTYKDDIHKKIEKNNLKEEYNNHKRIKINNQSR